MAAIIYSNLDLAGKNIARELKEKHGFKPAEAVNAGGHLLPAWKKDDGLHLIEIPTPTITSDYLDSLKADLIVFASKHKSESGKPTLTAHACGNWNDKADFGGKPRTLAPTSALAIKAAMKSIAKSAASNSALSGFDVVLECTHHGPLLTTPFLFVEIGSTEKEWGLPAPAEAVAEACIAACKAKPASENVAIGIGGIHYPREFTKAVLREGNEVAVGHICPKYAIGFLDEEMLSQMLSKSGGKVGLALIGWKSLNSEERANAIALLNAFNVPFDKV
ncbi:D-aminoacyl-tRNA deacylase [uncultured archaeon]|nr:D-aminoacyl-tRNA deacylase [uncultured archaeon]